MTSGDIEFNENLCAPFFECKDDKRITAKQTVTGEYAYFYEGKRLCEHSHSKYDLLDWVNRCYEKKLEKNRFVLKRVCQTCHRATRINAYDPKTLATIFSVSDMEIIKLNQNPEELEYTPKSSFSDISFSQFYQQIHGHFNFDNNEDMNQALKSEDPYLALVPKPVRVEIGRSITLGFMDRYRDRQGNPNLGLFDHFVGKPIVSIGEGVAIWIFLLLKVQDFERYYLWEKQIDIRGLMEFELVYHFCEYIKLVTKQLALESKSFFERFNDYITVEAVPPSLNNDNNRYYYIRPAIFEFIKNTKNTNANNLVFITYYLLRQFFNLSGTSIIKCRDKKTRLMRVVFGIYHELDEQELYSRFEKRKFEINGVPIKHFHLPTEKVNLRKELSFLILDTDLQKGKFETLTTFKNYNIIYSILYDLRSLSTMLIEDTMIGMHFISESGIRGADFTSELEKFEKTETMPPPPIGLGYLSLGYPEIDRMLQFLRLLDLRGIDNNFLNVLVEATQQNPFGNYDPEYIYIQIVTMSATLIDLFTDYLKNYSTLNLLVVKFFIDIIVNTLEEFRHNHNLDPLKYLNIAELSDAFESDLKSLTEEIALRKENEFKEHKYSSILDIINDREFVLNRFLLRNRVKYLSQTQYYIQRAIEQ